MLTITMPLASVKEVLSATELVSTTNPDFIAGVQIMKSAIATPAPARAVREVALIRVTENGLDVGLAVNGSLIATADPYSGDDAEVLVRIAQELCRLCALELVELSVVAHTDWQCGGARARPAGERQACAVCRSVHFNLFLARQDRATQKSGL